MRLRSLVPLLVACLFLATDGPAFSSGVPQAQTIPGLGTGTFPTTTRSAEAQTAFMRGLLLLHVFEYTSAADAFQSAEALDPGFAMAYWGEAMTANHPVWNQLNQEAGQIALAKFGATAGERAKRTADARERRYLGAVEMLYDPAGTKVERDARYTEAMRTLSAAYPDDDEARLFYSLALLGKSEGKRDVPVYLKAAEIAKAVFARNPQHPGAAHYWIHGMDDPEHAAGALVAARALSQIAPDAGHAQHMCSHIFMALGMWNEVVEANEAAVRVVAAQDRAEGRPVVSCFHYNQWLEYGYFQQGRRRKAEEMVGACKESAAEATGKLGGGHAGMSQMGRSATPEAMARAATASLIEMRDIAVIESEDWSGAAARMEIYGGQARSAGWYAFATGYAAAMRGDSEGAIKALLRLKQVRSTPNAESPADPVAGAYLSALEDELAGLMASKAGHMQEAVERVRKAGETYRSQPFDFGPPAVAKPPEELLGELLLGQGDGRGAVQAFHASLELAPNRAQSLIGLARAQRLAGEAAFSQVTWRQVLAQWTEADGDLPELAEAHGALVVVGKGPSTASLDARLDIHRACSAQQDVSEGDHGLHHHDEAGALGDHRDPCW